MSHTLEDQKLKYLEELLDTLKTIKNDVKKRNIALLKYYRDKYIINEVRNKILKRELNKEDVAPSLEFLNKKVNEGLFRRGVFLNLFRVDTSSGESLVINNLNNLIILQKSIEKNIKLFLEQGGDEKLLEELSKPLSEKDYLESVELERQNKDYEEAKEMFPGRTRFFRRSKRKKGGKKNKNKNKTLKKRKMNKKK